MSRGRPPKLRPLLPGAVGPLAAFPADIVEAMTDPVWWGPWFAKGDWTRWHVFLRTLFGLPLSAAELAFHRDCTGRPQRLVRTQALSLRP